MTNNFSTKTPPSGNVSFDVPLAHKIYKFYKKIYLLSSKIPKRDRFGIYLKIDSLLLEIMDLTITAALQSKSAKLPTLNSARIKIEVMKRFIRLVGELDIIKNERYLELEKDLQDISKDTNNWMISLIPKPTNEEIPR